MKETIVLLSQIPRLPQTAGIYLFYKKSDLIYIGKAINIRVRVKNHFQQPSFRDALFMSSVDRIGFVETGSEIEALILEASLIKKHLPKFNVIWRDDKNYFYVAITKEAKSRSPRDRGSSIVSGPVISITHQKSDGNTTYLGPFVEGNSLKRVLKFLRRVFPFYTTSRHPKQKCTWCHLGLCPGPEPDVAGYKKNIKKLILILQGKRKRVLSSLRKDMQKLAKEDKFEEAGKIRDKISALEQIMAHAKVIESGQMHGETWEATQKLLETLLATGGRIERIECYDISNIQGKSATGSMVVFTNGKPEKSQYKKFKIKMKQEPNDIAMLKEVFNRRFLHPEWPYAQVLLIDGGIAQLNAAINVKSGYSNVKSRVISIAKGRQELFIEGKKEPIPLKNLPQEVYNLVKHLDDEAHRFAISYHKLLRSKKIMGRNT